MIIGHYAAALIPYSFFKKVPLWFFLLLANLPDFLWLVFALIGLEPTAPQHFWQASFDGIAVEMTFSHDLLPSLFLAGLLSFLVFLIFKKVSLALSSGALIMAHHLADLLSGFPHYVLGPESAQLGLGLYYHGPYLALVLEALFACALLWLYFFLEARQGRPKGLAHQLKLYALFIVGSLMWLPVARFSMSEIYQLLF